MRIRKRKASRVDVQSYVSLSHQMALQRRLDVVANNIANMNTAGFRREDTLFTSSRERLGGDMPLSVQSVNYVLDRGLTLDSNAGPLTQTGNPLDIAIEGDFWLPVAANDGLPAYSRGGHLQVLPTGELALSTGEIVLGEGGAPIVLAPDDTDIEIGPDGEVSASEGPAGRLELFRFAADARPRRIGSGLMRAEAVPAAPGEARIRPGMIEGSNVAAIAETTRMIEILRAYQSSQRLNERVNDIRERAIQRLGRVE